MQEVAAYLDYVNLMTYDFHTGASDTVGHHSNLYSTRKSDRSAHRGISDFLAAGVPAAKIVVGLPFYGRSWIMPDSVDHGIERVAKSVAKSGGFTFIKDSLVNRNGFHRHWDTDAQAPYLFNPETNQLVVYDDEESVKIKCEYVLKNNLGGVMFWEYENDPKLYLLNVINEHLSK